PQQHELNPFHKQVGHRHLMVFLVSGGVSKPARTAADPRFIVLGTLFMAIPLVCQVKRPDQVYMQNILQILLKYVNSAPTS
ncbi:MAG TPA: hypothetical protein PLZ16_09485, partial [Gammaproteobacteria bacterium]|nr:hypothetical protein [Gammaproteobacteria bacterium]